MFIFATQYKHIFMFNYDKGQYTTDKDFQKLLEIYDNFVNEKLELVKEGKV